MSSSASTSASSSAMDYWGRYMVGKRDMYGSAWFTSMSTTRMVTMMAVVRVMVVMMTMMAVMMTMMAVMAVMMTVMAVMMTVMAVMMTAIVTCSIV